MYPSHVQELLPTSWNLDLDFILINQLIKGVVSQHPTDHSQKRDGFPKDENNVGFWFMLPRFFLSGCCGFFFFFSVLFVCFKIIIYLAALGLG